MRSRKLINGALLNLINLIAQILSGFYVMPLMIKTFGDALFGIWLLVGSFLGFSAVLDLGLPSAVSRFISQAIGKGGENQSKETKFITATAFYIFIVISIMSMFIIAIAIIFAPAFLKDSSQITLFRELLLILCINNLFVYPTSIFEGILVAHLRFDLVNSRRIFFTVLKVALTIIFVKNNYNLIVIAWSITICNILENLTRLYFAYRLDPNISISIKDFNFEKVKKLFGYSIFTFIAKIADTLRFQINSLIITIFTNIALVTPFRVASRLVEYFIQFIGEIAGVFSPYFSQEEGKNNHAGIKEKFLFLTKIMTYIATFAGLMLLLYGKDFITRWVGPQYKISYNILVIIVIPITFALIQSSIFPLLYGISKHHFVAYTNIGEGLMNLVLSIILVKRFGIIGVALGTAIPLIITKLLIQPLYVSRLLKINVVEYFMLILIPLLKGILVVMIPWLLISGYIRPVYLNLFMFGMMQAIIYLLIVYYIGFNRGDKDYLLSILKFKKVNF